MPANTDSGRPQNAPSPNSSPLRDRIPSFGARGFFASPLARCACVGLLTLILLIPLSFVRSVVYERMHLYNEAVGNITSSWGGAQTVSGPALIIPYQVWEDRKEIVKEKTSVNGKEVIESKEVVTRHYLKRYKVVLPSDLSFNAVLDPEVRYRGIYRQTLYTAPVDIAGAFSLPQEKHFADNLHKILWEQTWLVAGVTDLKTIVQPDPVNWAGKRMAPYSPGSGAGDLVGPGFQTSIPLAAEDAGKIRPFSLRLKVRGSGGLFFTPVGENTVITMSGNWNAPSFQGNLLPVERKIRDDGFSAKWVISNLTRTYPQMADYNSDRFKGRYKESAITEFTAGVDLHEPVTLYRMVRRSVDYGILFIAVSFVALFAFELASRQRMHLLQYGMVGLSMSLFYLVLLSLAEHISFGLAFTAASAVTVLMNGWYVGAAMRSRGKGIFMGTLLTGLYIVLFSLLKMEDFSLLAGTALVLAMMFALMYFTRSLPQNGRDTPE